MRRKNMIVSVLALAASLTCILPASVERVAAKSPHPDGYLSEENAPVIYGSTAITLPLDSMQEFNPLDSRFRAFAADIEDGDLTQKMSVTGTVDIHTAGEYTLTYTVCDSDGNSTVLDVPVRVEAGIDRYTIERTLYSLPSWHWVTRSGVGLAKGYNGDRQHLGIYVPAGVSYELRITQGNGSDFKLASNTNDQGKETTTMIPKNGSWITKTGTGVSGDIAGVPAVYSPVLPAVDGLTPKDQLNQTYTFEIRYGDDVQELDLYRYGDDEARFRQKWQNSQAEYAIIESNRCYMIVPIGDEPHLTGPGISQFSTVDKMLDFYSDLFDRYDSILGLERDAENRSHINTHFKQTIRANKSGAGLAYWNRDHIGYNGASMKGYFSIGWVILHEIGHGYQGDLLGTNSTMALGEVSNNILGYYVQNDRSIYPAEQSWLGSKKEQEDKWNLKERGTMPFNSLNLSTRLYFIVNLFDSIDGEHTYTAINRLYRELNDMGWQMTNTDAYIMGIAHTYGLNVIPYFEKWLLQPSDEVRTAIMSADLPMTSTPQDLMDSTQILEYLSATGRELRFEQVTGKDLAAAGFTGNLTLTICKEDLSGILGKAVRIMDGKEVLQEKKVTGDTLVFQDLPIGTYTLQMPVADGQFASRDYVEIAAGSNTKTYTYTAAEPAFYAYNPQLLLSGNRQLAFSAAFTGNDFSHARITVNPATNNGSSDVYVKLFDPSGLLVKEWSVDANHQFLPAEGLEYDFEYGEVFEIRSAAGRACVSNRADSYEVPETRSTEEVTRYLVTPYGIVKEEKGIKGAMEQNGEMFLKYRSREVDYWHSAISEEDAQDRCRAQAAKSFLMRTAALLSETASAPYRDTIEAILKGGSPVVTYSGPHTITDPSFTEKDLYAGLSGWDAEDGTMSFDSTNTTVRWNWSRGDLTAEAEITVLDTDGNAWSRIIPLKINITEDTSPSVPDNPSVPDSEPEDTDMPSSPDQETQQPEEKPAAPGSEGTPDGEETPEEEERPPFSEGGNSQITEETGENGSAPEEGPDHPIAGDKEDDDTSFSGSPSDKTPENETDASNKLEIIPAGDFAKKHETALWLSGVFVLTAGIAVFFLRRFRKKS